MQVLNAIKKPYVLSLRQLSVSLNWESRVHLLEVLVEDGGCFIAHRENIQLLGY